MAEYTTGAKICHEGGHEITDAPAIDNIGYKHPTKNDDELYDAAGKAEHRKTYYKLCKAHYLEAFAESYPEAELPAI